MTTKKGSTKKRADKEREAEELGVFAHHLSEVLRIARAHPYITSRFYNDLADAWNNFTNEVLSKSNAWESEDYIRLMLDAHARSEKGDAK